MSDGITDAWKFIEDEEKGNLKIPNWNPKGNLMIDYLLDKFEEENKNIDNNYESEKI